MVNMSRPGNNRRSGSFRGFEGNKVFVSNIDFSCTHQDLKDAFKEVGEVAFVEMLKDNNQKPNGCAIVRFKQSNMADEAIKIMNRYELNGRKLVVKDEKDAPKDKVMKDRKRPREDDHYDRHMPSNDNFGKTYGLSLQFLESLGIDAPLVERIFVANLDYSVNEDMLKEVFNLAGKVLDIDLAKGDDGKSKGYAFIEYEHPIEAVQAISMLHNQIYIDRPMSVQLTRKERKRDGAVRLPSGLKSIGVGLGINGTPLKDVARTIEAGNQSSLLGAMPAQGLGIPSLPMNNMGPMGGVGLGHAVTGGLGGGIPGGPLGPDLSLGHTMTASLTQNLSHLSGASGLGLMDRTSSLGLGMGGMNSASSTQSFRGLSNAATNFRNAVQISNLPNDYSWKSLQNLCMPFGDITFSKITARGVGIVQFENEAAARRATDMLDHQRFEGRYLETRLL